MTHRLSESLGFSAEVLAKGRELLETGESVTADREHPSVWWVRSSRDRSRVYRVQSDFDPRTRRLSWISCTCPHGLNTGFGSSHCYHSAAVLLVLRDAHPEETGEP